MRDPLFISTCLLVTHFFVKLVEDAYKSVNIEPTILIALFQCLYFSFISQSIFFLSKTKTDLIFFYSSSLGNEAAECTVCMVKLWVMAATDELFGSSSTFFWNKKSKQKLKQKSKRKIKQNSKQTTQTKSEAHLWNWSRTLANWWQNRCWQVWRWHFWLLIYGIQFDSIFQCLTWIKIRLQTRYFVRICHISILLHSGKFCLK